MSAFPAIVDADLDRNSPHSGADRTTTTSGSVGERRRERDDYLSERLLRRRSTARVSADLAVAIAGAGAITTITLSAPAEANPTDRWPASGYALIDSEVFVYGAKTASQLTGVTRAQQGTSAAAHAIGAVVSQWIELTADLVKPTAWAVYPQSVDLVGDAAGNDGFRVSQYDRTVEVTWGFEAENDGSGGVGSFTTLVRAGYVLGDGFPVVAFFAETETPDAVIVTWKFYLTANAGAFDLRLRISYSGLAAGNSLFVTGRASLWRL